MSKLYITNAAALSPLGGSLNEIWRQVLQGNAVYGHAHLPGQRDFFVAETVPGSGSDIATYASLFKTAIHRLVEQLEIDTPVDAIFFASAVGNLAEVESDIYADRPVSLEQLDFSALEAIFAKTAACGDRTKFVCIPTGCCAGLQAIGLAKSAMPHLGLKRALIMSLDFGLTPMALEAFKKINATHTYDPAIPGSPSRPFCRDRDGFLFADGGGAILVTTEEPEQPVPYISGYGCVSSAYHMTDIATDGSSIRQSIEQAIGDAGTTGGAIDHVNLHASGTQQNDQAEYQALVDVIGSSLPPVTAFKGNHGHALGGANMIEVALAWKMMTAGILPPTAKSLPVDAYEAVPPREQAVSLHVASLLKTASGFSGIHAAMIMENGNV
ncbi:TPA: hypothetical protein G5T75_004897 [Salmonella enterica]|uniref:Ketosynthase family 3 (KS3) domain-containing protein n=1 Tax=Salmonella enterica TaxID=28901 RepID=A0A754B6N2_SALER|nr:beta-ketoacyl synthase N-terminal-like domain-containing protein [Salmonella enterica]ECU9164117.1 hypothetical protein [Salmonella enterica subsp. enterica serovar Newport str. CFSAN000599]EDU1196817.1 hypothetical protein [Salmonella enterica subsp. enterica serovar Heidelberg str. CFSAN000576]HAF8580914.1 hypothetical protein [Salmonella enterica]